MRLELGKDPLDGFEVERIGWQIPHGVSVVSWQTDADRTGVIPAIEGDPLRDGPGRTAGTYGGSEAMITSEDVRRGLCRLVRRLLQHQ